MEKEGIKMKKNFLIVLVVMGLMLAACSNADLDSSKNDSKVEVKEAEESKGEEAKVNSKEVKPAIVLSRWAGPHADDQKTVAGKFELADVQIDDIDYGNLKQKQTGSMAASGDYDLVWCQEIWTPEYVEKGWLMPLDDYVTDNGTDLSVYSPSMIDMNTFDDKLYALPTFAQTHILTYNKEWFEKEGQVVPTTPEELVALAKYFHEKGTGIAIPASQGQAAVDVFAQLLYSAGGDYFDANGTLALNSEAALEAGKLWDDLCRYSITGSETWHHDQVSQAVREENAPFGITVTGLAFMDMDPELSKIVDKAAYAPIPGSAGSNGVVSFWSWGVAANSENPEIAYKVAAWLTSPEIEKEQALMNGQVTAISSLAEDDDVVAKIPSLPAISATLANAKTQPTSSSAAQIFEALGTALSKVATTDELPDDVFAELNDYLTGVIE